ncbi:DUF4411 family protein [Actinocatenispora sera]|uniref:Nucleic acid-binding protein n=1 Tax=Actinocatenispora sera TaxID=390989 RepID=A0A810KXX6_9ACTN|nr:DUF4411 family protein [Actinocatenispora sera]BCJ26888.1 hypothetical protein Asera_09960 [Actinocatenispora sera]
MYLIDTNVLIDAKNRHYAFDIVPAFWDWLKQGHKAGKVFTVEKVAEEILGTADELAAWLRKLPPAFRLTPHPKDTASLTALSKWASSGHYTSAAVSTFLSSADYFLVAQACSHHCVVVTHETADPASKRRVKIPDACAALKVVP